MQQAAAPATANAPPNPANAPAQGEMPPDLMERGVSHVLVKLQSQDQHGSSHQVGTATLQLRGLLGRGGEADVFVVDVLSYQLDAAAVAAHPPPWGTIGSYPAARAALKVLRPFQAVMSELQRRQHVAAMAPAFYQETRTISALTSTGQAGSDDDDEDEDNASTNYFISTYGYGMAVEASAPQLSAGGSSSGGGGSGGSRSRQPGLAGYAGGLPCVLLQLAEAGSVQQLLWNTDGSRRQLAANPTSHILCSVRAALEEHQRRGYYEVDLKAENLLLVRSADDSSKPEVLLCDFGATFKTNLQGVIKNSGNFGTPGLMPPERYLGISTSTWQLGLLLLTCRGGCALPPGLSSVEAVQDSGLFDHLLPLEWELLELCLAPSGDRPPPKQLKDETDYFWTLIEPTQPCTFFD